MNEQTTVSIRDGSARLEGRYPQLKGFLDDLDGFYQFVLNLLRMFKLMGLYSPDDIINECLLRWYTAVENGKVIPVLAGWMRSTALNVVRELSRANKKASSYDPTVLEELVSETYETTQENSEQHRLIHQALQALPEDKRELVQLRFFHKLPWETIAEIYANRGQKVSVPTLRKRGERAMNELRQVFLNILKET